MSGIGESHFDSLITEGMEVLKDTFAEPVVTYCPRTGRAFDIRAIFDEAHAVVDSSGEVPFETVKPVLSIATLDLRSAGHKDPVRGDKIIIRRKSGDLRFFIAEIMPDGRSEVKLVLSETETRA